MAALWMAVLIARGLRVGVDTIQELGPTCLSLTQVPILPGWGRRSDKAATAPGGREGARYQEGSESRAKCLALLMVPPGDPWVVTVSEV